MTPVNAEGMLRGRRDFDWIKVDIDSTDCVILEALLHIGVRAKGIILEIDQGVPPPFVRVNVVSKTVNHLTAGCSLSAQVQLLHKYGYHLYEFYQPTQFAPFRQIEGGRVHQKSLRAKNCD